RSMTIWAQRSTLPSSPFWPPPARAPALILHTSFYPVPANLRLTGGAAPGHTRGRDCGRAPPDGRPARDRVAAVGDPSRGAPRRRRDPGFAGGPCPIRAHHPRRPAIPHPCGLHGGAPSPPPCT